MTARELGAIVAKVLAVFVAMRGCLVVATEVSEAITEGIRYISWSFCILGSMYGLMALMLWVQADKFWPSDAVIAETPGLNARGWFGLALVGIAALAVIVSVPTVLVSLLEVAGVLESRRPRIAWGHLLQALLGIGILIYGSRMFREEA